WKASTASRGTAPRCCSRTCAVTSGCRTRTATRCPNCRGSPRRATRRPKPRARREPEMAAARMDYEPAGELKIGQVGIANLRVRTLDAARLAEEMRERVARAPKLFERAAVVIDF